MQSIPSQVCHGVASHTRVKSATFKLAHVCMILSSAAEIKINPLHHYKTQTHKYAALIRSWSSQSKCHHHLVCANSGPKSGGALKHSNLRKMVPTTMRREVRGGFQLHCYNKPIDYNGFSIILETVRHHAFAYMRFLTYVQEKGDQETLAAHCNAYRNEWEDG